MNLNEGGVTYEMKNKLKKILEGNDYKTELKGKYLLAEKDGFEYTISIVDYEKVSYQNLEKDLAGIQGNIPVVIFNCGRMLAFWRPAGRNPIITTLHDLFYINEDEICKH